MKKKLGVWFRRDLRLQDHTALFYAMNWCEEHDGEWFGFFHLDPKFVNDINPHHSYFFQTLQSFKQEALKNGIKLYLLFGEIEQVIEQLTQEVPDLAGIYFNKDEVGDGFVRDHLVVSLLKEKNIEVKAFHDAHIHSANEITKNDGSYYKVYTPYYRTWLKAEKPTTYDINKSKLRNYQSRDKLKETGKELFIQIIDRSRKFNFDIYTEEQAKKTFTEFIEVKIEKYEIDRNFPFIKGTSMLSPLLKTGVISIRTVWRMIQQLRLNPDENEGITTFIKELAWRDFYNMVYAKFPKSKDIEIDKRYQNLNWSKSIEAFECWCAGRTGYPIIDAAMRQLQKQGWMHNRLRMVAASFLTKDLFIDWRLGERFFQKMLIDYDEASNIGNWQWAASVGTDAVPYFRVFNPITQSKRFDPEGEFIRRYIPELERVEKKFIHEPWKMPLSVQKEINCEIGKHYPKPIVDHNQARNYAIERFREVSS